MSNEKKMKQIQMAVQVLSEGGIIVYPTETLWGLGVDAFHVEAVKRLRCLKKRQSQKAFSILVRDIQDAQKYAFVDKTIEKFLQIIWPGPVTLVLKVRHKKLSSIIGEEDTIGLRCSNHPFVHQLVWIYNNPIITTSANFSGQAPLQDVNDLQVFEKKKCFICSNSEERGVKKSISQGSTVVRFTQKRLQILRQGDVSFCILKKLVAGAGFEPTTFGL